MQIFLTDFAPPCQAVQNHLYTALELLRLCDQQINAALEAIDVFALPVELLPHLMEGDDGLCDVDADWLYGIRAVCRLHVMMLQEVAAGIPQLPERVFRDLPAHRGCEHDPPHLGAVALTLNLAAQHLLKAMCLSAEHDGEDVDDFYCLMHAAYLGVSSEANHLESALRGGFCEDELEAILAGESIKVA